MKKFALLAVVAAFASTVIGCGPSATSGGGTKATTTSTQTAETKK